MSSHPLHISPVMKSLAMCDGPAHVMAAHTGAKYESVPKPMSFTVSLNLQIRPLSEADFHKNFFPLLNQLSSVGDVSEEFFAAQLQALHQDAMQRMLVCEDVSLGRIVATGTMVVEPKFIHNTGFAGHLEDLVVDHALRAKGIGKLLVDQLLQFARAKSCYKVIVDCGEHNTSFYTKCGFKRKEISMACYFKDHKPATPADSLETLSMQDPATTSVALLQMLKDRPPQHVDGLIIRYLEEGDYHKRFLPLLGQLTAVGDISEAVFVQRVARVRTDVFQHVIVIEMPGHVSFMINNVILIFF